MSTKQPDPSPGPSTPGMSSPAPPPIIGGGKPEELRQLRAERDEAWQAKTIAETERDEMRKELDSRINECKQLHSRLDSSLEKAVAFAERYLQAKERLAAWEAIAPKLRKLLEQAPSRSEAHAFKDELPPEPAAKTEGMSINTRDENGVRMDTSQKRVEELEKSELISCPKCGIEGKPCLCDLPKPPRNIFTDPKDGDRFKYHGEERVCKNGRAYENGEKRYEMFWYEHSPNVSDIRRVDDPPAKPEEPKPITREEFINLPPGSTWEAETWDGWKKRVWDGRIIVGSRYGAGTTLAMYWDMKNKVRNVKPAKPPATPAPAEVPAPKPKRRRFVLEEYEYWETGWTHEISDRQGHKTMFTLVPVEEA